MDKELFVKNVEKICGEKGIKPTVACVESGAGRNFLVQIKGRGSVPSVEKVQLLAQYLGCTVSDLLGEQPPKNAKAAAPEGSGLSEEFARIFQGLTPENQNKIISEMLRRQREQESPSDPTEAAE
nr:MAG TPA: ESX-1 secretion-associated regulator [Caudoviricetes sp.]